MKHLHLRFPVALALLVATAVHGQPETFPSGLLNRNGGVATLGTHTYLAGDYAFWRFDPEAEAFVFADALGFDDCADFDAPTLWDGFVVYEGAAYFLAAGWNEEERTCHAAVRRYHPGAPSERFALLPGIEPNLAFPEELTLLDDHLYFRTFHPDLSFSVWTVSLDTGTLRPVAAADSTQPSLVPDDLVAYDGFLFFEGRDFDAPEGGRVLWTYDPQADTSGVAALHYQRLFDGSAPVEIGGLTYFYDAEVEALAEYDPASESVRTLGEVGPLSRHSYHRLAAHEGRVFLDSEALWVYDVAADRLTGPTATPFRMGEARPTGPVVLFQAYRRGHERTPYDQSWCLWNEGLRCLPAPSEGDYLNALLLDGTPYLVHYRARNDYALVPLDPEAFGSLPSD